MMRNSYHPRCLPSHGPFHAPSAPMLSEKSWEEAVGKARRGVREEVLLSMHARWPNLLTDRQKADIPDMDLCDVIEMYGAILFDKGKEIGLKEERRALEKLSDKEIE